MALRNIRREDDEILRKKTREVTQITPAIITLLDDMLETMIKENGVGLAAPQVGVLKKIAIVDIGEGLFEFINPVIVEESGEQIEVEGCLSIPNKAGEVKRPQRVVVKATDRNGEKFTLKAEGFLARAICHELDHLNSILFIDKVIRYVDIEKK